MEPVEERLEDAAHKVRTDPRVSPEIDARGTDLTRAAHPPRRDGWQEDPGDFAQAGIEIDFTL